MIRRNTWVAVAFFGAFAALAVVLIRGRNEGPGIEPTPTLQPLWAVSSDEVLALRLEQPAADTVVRLERDQEQLWRSAEPVGGEADAPGVERAVSWLSSPNPTSQIAGDQDFEIYELEPPQYRIEIWLRDGSNYMLLVGRETPTGNARYVTTPNSGLVWTVRTLGLDEVLGLLSAPLAGPEASDD